MYFNQKQKGVILFLEHIEELYNDVRYELMGPEGYDIDYKNQLKESGLWEDEVEEYNKYWSSLTDGERIRLDERYDTLSDILRLGDTLIKKAQNDEYR